jgi:hypothetical protein
MGGAHRTRLAISQTKHIKEETQYRKGKGDSLTAVGTMQIQLNMRFEKGAFE